MNIEYKQFNKSDRIVVIELIKSLYNKDFKLKTIKMDKIYKIYVEGYAIRLFIHSKNGYTSLEKLAMEIIDMR